MAAYVGDVVAIQIKAQDPFTKAYLTGDYSATVDVYAPGINPKTTPAVREVDDDILIKALPAIYDSGTQAWYAYVATDSTQFDGLEAVTIYWYRVIFQGPTFRNIEFGSFKLAP